MWSGYSLITSITSRMKKQKSEGSNASDGTQSSSLKEDGLEYTVAHVVPHRILPR